MNKKFFTDELRAWYEYRYLRNRETTGQYILEGEGGGANIYKYILIDLGGSRVFWTILIFTQILCDQCSSTVSEYYKNKLFIPNTGIKQGMFITSTNSNIPLMHNNVKLILRNAGFEGLWYF